LEELRLVSRARAGGLGWVETRNSKYEARNEFEWLNTEMF